jgi:hypothetical protein
MGNYFEDASGLIGKLMKTIAGQVPQEWDKVTAKIGFPNEDVIDMEFRYFVKGEEKSFVVKNVADLALEIKNITSTKEKGVVNKLWAEIDKTGKFNLSFEYDR